MGISEDPGFFNAGKTAPFRGSFRGGGQQGDRHPHPSTAQRCSFVPNFFLKRRNFSCKLSFSRINATCKPKKNRVYDRTHVSNNPIFNIVFLPAEELLLI